jgi:hypothetical protein
MRYIFLQRLFPNNVRLQAFGLFDKDKGKKLINKIFHIILSKLAHVFLGLIL